MFLGRYDYTGDHQVLMAAYDRFMATVPDENLPWHTLVQTADGISIFDACPSAEVFDSFSTDADVIATMGVAGLPAPTVTPIGDVLVTRGSSAGYRADTLG